MRDLTSGLYDLPMDPLLSAYRAAMDLVRLGEKAMVEMEPLIKLASVSAAQFEKLISPDQLAYIARIAADLAEQAKRNAEEEPLLRELYGTLADRGWVGLENHLGADATDRFLADVKTNGLEWLDEEICSGFRENDYGVLTDIQKEWRAVPYLVERHEIVEDALLAHRQGRYALSIPTLLPFVDGLAADIVGAPPSRGGKAIYVAEAAKEYHAAEAQAWSDGLLRVILEQMYKRYCFGSEPPPTLINRHGVLHGRVSTYASEANSVRTILLVDVFARFSVEKRKCEQMSPEDTSRLMIRD